MNIYLKHNVKQLLKMQEDIINNPENKQSNKDSIYLYNAKARKKLDAISWAIYAKTVNKEAPLCNQ